MEGFVHQTREQRLSALRGALSQAYSVAKVSRDLDVDQVMKRIERAEQQLKRDEGEVEPKLAP